MCDGFTLETANTHMYNNTPSLLQITRHSFEGQHQSYSIQQKPLQRQYSGETAIP